MAHKYVMNTMFSGIHKQPNFQEVAVKCSEE